MGTIPTAPTFTASAVLTAANLNSLRDALNFWRQPPACLAYATAATTFPSGNIIAVALGGELFDIVQSGDSPMHDISTNNSRIYVRTAGMYEVSGQVVFGGNAAGTRTVGVRLNGSDIVYTINDHPSTAAATYVQTPVVQAIASAGDYFEITGLQTSGSTLTTAGTGRAYNYLSVKLISA